MDVLDAVRIDVGHARAALISVDEQLAKKEPDLFLVEGELERANHAVRTARHRVDHEIVRGAQR